MSEIMPPRKKRASPGKKRASAGRAPIALSIRGSAEWRRWLERAANHCGLTSSMLVEQAVAEYARAKGFPDPPPKR